MIRHQNGFSEHVSQTSCHGETSGDVAKYRLFPQAMTVICNIFSFDDLWMRPQIYAVTEHVR